MFPGVLALLERSLHEEFHGQTIAALTLLPKSIGTILYSKLVGVLLVWLPGPILLSLEFLQMQCSLTRRVISSKRF